MKLSTALSAGLPLLALSANSALASNFVATCGANHENSSMSLISSSDGWTLYAICKPKPGPVSRRFSQMNLSRCVANYHGTLAGQRNGGFSGSCRDCELENPSSRWSAWLRCRCGNGDGGTVMARIDLNNIIGNNDGRLSCYGYTGPSS